MSAAFQEGAVVAGWKVVGLQQDGATPRYTVKSEAGDDQGTLTHFPFQGEAAHRHRALADRAERGREVRGPGVEPIAVGRTGQGAYVVVPEAERFGEEALDPDRALDVLADLARALQSFHGAGRGHGEVDPWSVVRRGDGAALVPPGVRLGPAELEHQLDLHADPRYAAPEVLDGRPATPPSDAFSAGLVLYRLLTGEHPVAAVDPVDAFLARCKQPVPDLAAARGGLPERVLSLYGRLCADYDARPADARALLAEVERARKGPLPPPTVDVPSVRPAGLGCAVFALLLAAAALAGAVVYAERELPLTDPTAEAPLELPPAGPR